MDDVPTHRRRPRYRGTHPRKFHEKYKELEPVRHPGVADHVAARGKTPAGSHRPVMVDEVLATLRAAPGEIALDATLGGGGHAEALLERVMPGGRLVGLDVDPIELPRTTARLAALGHPADAVVTVRTNFAATRSVLTRLGIPAVQLVLADLGCSSMQLDNPDRGFTYKESGPLDLRMNPRRGEPASMLLRRLGVEGMRVLLEEGADEPHAARIATALGTATGKLATTDALAAVVRTAIPVGTEPDEVRATLARVFQALRIAVNDEMTVLELFLRSLPEVLAPGGRAVILSFHSGEDRRVKQAFAAGLRDGSYSQISRDPLRPSAAEVHANSRARSTKLRWCRRSDSSAV